MRLRPTRRSAAAVSAARRSAASGSGSRRVAFIAGRQRRPLRHTAPPPRRSRPCRRPPARAAKPSAVMRVDQIARQRRLAAEQMRAAGDVEHQAVRRIEPDQRRVAVAPVGDRFEQLRVGRRIFLHDHEIGMHGARLRQCLPPQAESFGCRIECDHLFGIAALAGDHQRARIRRPLPRDTVGRKLLQPEADDPLRARNAARHCSTPTSTIPGCPAGCA